jgi:hypothetical protein
MGPTAKGGHLVELVDIYDPERPQLIRWQSVIHVRIAEGHWLRFSGATAALEAFEEAERRWDAMSDEEREEVAA